MAWKAGNVGFVVVALLSAAWGACQDTAGLADEGACTGAACWDLVDSSQDDGVDVPGEDVPGDPEYPCSTVVLGSAECWAAFQCAAHCGNSGCWNVESACCRCRTRDCGKTCVRKSDCEGWCIACFNGPGGYHCDEEAPYVGYCGADPVVGEGRRLCGCHTYLDDQGNPESLCADPA